MTDHRLHLISKDSTAREGLKQLQDLPDNDSRTLFVVDNERVLGTITDGDIRRGLLDGREISEKISLFMNTEFKYIMEGVADLDMIKLCRKLDIKYLPLLNERHEIKGIVDLKRNRSALPICAILMAGGRGERLRPLTDNVPKPMLKVGEKPIIEHNIDRLIEYGVREIYISVGYMKEKIISYFGNGESKGVSIRYVEESKPLGTLGSLSCIDGITEEDILVMNSDLLTNIDFEDFYLFYKESKSVLSLASIPYTINIPYAVLEVEQNSIRSFKEKPSYTYYSNGGIYLMKSSCRDLIPKEQFYNSTDLMDQIISSGGEITHYPLLAYWMDIGNPQDYLKAQQDIQLVKL